MNRKQQFVERRPEQGDYAVRKPNSDRASVVKPTQRDAIDWAKAHNPDGGQILVERVRNTDPGHPDKMAEAVVEKKADCEQAIRYLCHEWGQVRGIPSRPVLQPSFIDFKSWLRENGYSHYLNFRSVMGPEEDAERWFDQEFGQMWRN